MKNLTILIIASIFFILVYSNGIFEFHGAIAVSIFFYWSTRLFVVANYYMPIKELLITLYSLQYLLSPALMYNGLQDYTDYKMKVDSLRYFTLAIPMILVFDIGFSLSFKSSRLKINKEKIDIWLQSHRKIPNLLIYIGFVAPFLYPILPSQVYFVIYLLECLKYIGLFLLISSSEKFKSGWLFLIYSLVIITSFLGGMFHDLLIWIIFLGLILCYRYKPNFIIKFIGLLFFVLFAMFVQNIKGGLRDIIWSGSKENVNIDLISKISEETNNEKGGFFSLETIGPEVNRINQGWVLAGIIDNVPANIEHSHGLLLKDYLIAALAPRFLVPDKLHGGDTKYFNMYSGHFVDIETVMVLGLLGEAYIEFEGMGSFIYILCFGILYGYILKLFQRKGEEFPILIVLTLLIFIYPIRPDCDTQTAFGHVIKASIAVFILISIYKSKFKMPIKNM